MKRIVLALLVCLVLTGCGNTGISQAKYNSVVSERDKLEEKVKKLEKQIEELEEEVAELEKALEESNKEEEVVVDSSVEEVIESKSEYVVGDTVETSTLRMTFISAGEYVSDNMFIQPKEGYVFWRFEFDCENISSEDELVSSWNFNCYADDYAMEQSYGDDDLQATLSSGKKTIGAVYYEIPSGAESIVLEYDVNAWTGEKVVFIAK